MEQEREGARKTMSELAEGQSCEGLVRKIIDAGVFVDLGGVDGFIPISQLGWGRVKHPSDVVKEGERIVVTVTKIDQEKDRITLSFRDAALDPWNSVESNVKVGDILRGTVVSIMSFGAFVDVGNNLEGLVHISEIAYQRVNSVEDVLNVGDVVNVLVLGVDLERRRISLSIKQTMENPRIKAKREEQEKLAEEQDRKDEEAAQAAIASESFGLKVRSRVGLDPETTAEQVSIFNSRHIGANYSTGTLLAAFPFFFLHTNKFIHII